MKKLIAIASALLLATSLATPAQSANVKYTVYQKTLATFSSSATGLTSQQKAQVKATVEANPAAEKFICTGIRYYSQPTSVNIMVRKRAKAACDYAKQLNPNLSTWFQNKPTQARSYAGKVLLTVKSIAEDVAQNSDVFVETDSLPIPTYDLVEGSSCIDSSWPVLGFLKNGDLAYLECYGEGGNWEKSRRLFDIDQDSLKPLVPVAVPAKSVIAYSPLVYIQPQVSTERPDAQLSPASRFTDVELCRLPELDTTGRPHMVSGFPMAANRAIMDDEVIVQLVPVDFADFRSTSSPKDDFADATKAVGEFWSRMSDGKTNITFRVPEQYFDLAGNVGSYGLEGVFPNFDGAKYGQYVGAAVAASDSAINFSDADVVMVVHTPNVPKNAVATFVAEAGLPDSVLVAKTAEKTVYNTLIQGGDWPRDIQNWIHEFGHMLGLTDGGLGSMVFDVMLWYGNPELTVWNRFVLGIEKDSQLHCKTDLSTSTHLVSPVAWPGDRVEGVVIPLATGRAIVVESRRRTGYDALLGKESEGALVYEVDTSKSGNGPDAVFQVIAPSRVELQRFSMDTPLKQGESVVHQGWKITNVESGSFGDVVTVEKVS